MSGRFAGALVLLAVLAAGWMGFRAWQGPVVQTALLTPTPLVQTVVATGRVASAARAQVGAEITAVVIERHVREGDTVKAGDVLLTLRSDEAAARVREAQAALDNLRHARRPQAMAAFAQAQSQLAQAKREAQRRVELFRSESISREVFEKAEQALAVAQAADDQARLLADSLAPGGSEETILIERLAAAQAALSKTTVLAEFDGTVLTRQVEAGDLVQPGRVLLEIARAGQTDILVPVDERNLGVLALDQRTLCIADAYPNNPFEARVAHIAPIVDPQRGTVDVRLTVSQPPVFLREDMTVTATIVTGQRDQALVVTNDALRNVQGDQADIQVIEFGRIATRRVTLGLRGLTQTEVLQGLQAGDRIVLTPGFVSGQRVRATDVD
jgi:HlyD family secretion protein